MFLWGGTLKKNSLEGGAELLLVEATKSSNVSFFYALVSGGACLVLPKKHWGTVLRPLSIRRASC